MRDLLLSLRMLRKSPLVTAIAILSLGLGIGANTAIFAIFDTVLLQPLPVDAPEELVNLGAPGLKNGDQSCNNSGDCDAVFSYPMFRDLEREQRVFTGLAGHRLFGANIGYKDQTLTGDGAEVSGNYFNVLRLKPSLGRLLNASDDERVGESPVVVLAHQYWQERFDSNPGVVGQTLVINGHPLTVIGVGPPGFDGTSRGTQVQVFVPITLRGLMEVPFSDYDKRTSYWVYLFGRLKPGVTVDLARTGINVPYRTLIEQADAPVSDLSAEQRTEFLRRQATVEDGRRGQSSIFTGAKTTLLVLQSVTLVVLLIACANIANLLLARGAGRAGEMAIRLSIGASRAQLIRQLIVESCLLAIAGGLAGLLFMRWTVLLIAARLPFGSLPLPEAGANSHTLMFTAGVSLLTGVCFGLFPALHATRPDLAATLKGQSGQPSGARSAARFRTVLVVSQIALSMGLLTCAGLFARSLMNLSRVDLGVQIDQVMTFSLSPLRNGYPAERSRQLFQDVEDRLAATPGVIDVAAGRVALLSNSSSSTGITVEGYKRAQGERTSANYNEVSPGYFRTVGVPLLAGRDFTASDNLTAPKVVIVNEAFARKFGLGPNPVGKRMRRGGSDKDPLNLEIVGLVRDAKYNKVRDAVPAQFFLPYRQNATIGSLSFYVKTAGDQAALFGTIRKTVASLDSNLPVQRMRSMREQVASTVAGDRLTSTLSASFALLATLLAAIGLYGVLSYTVSQRRREFGVRMALGAAPAAVQRLVLRQVMRMAAVGGAIGLAIAIGVGRLASAQLFETGSYDPAVLTASAAVLALVALAAGFVPARRASRTDPMRALRTE
ncbi:MAG TPA: ABC transporter permease [Vicinamibacterales bacterium]|nr:ABC transporter permease [Vicinamibacterales bacterium]